MTNAKETSSKGCRRNNAEDSSVWSDEVEDLKFVAGKMGLALSEPLNPKGPWPSQAGKKAADLGHIWQY
jgi:hypothetical protein